MDLSSIVLNYTREPKKYILQLTKDKKGIEHLKFLKKGVWTWLKIHVGSWLHCFSRSTVDIDHIRDYALKNRPAIENMPVGAAFYESFDRKIRKWNSKHQDKTALIPFKEHAFEFEADSKKLDPIIFSNNPNWEISEEIGKTLPQKHLASINVKDSKKGKQIDLVLSRLFREGKGDPLLSKEAINYEKLLKSFMPMSKDIKTDLRELKKLNAQKIEHITLTIEKQNAGPVKIFLDLY